MPGKLSREIYRPRRYKTSLFIIVLQRVVGCPYVYPDPFGPPLSRGAYACPVVEGSTYSPPREVPVDNQPRNVGRWRAFLLFSPQQFVGMLPVGDGGHGDAAVVFGNPCLALVATAEYPFVPCFAVGPRLAPLVGALSLGPEARLVDEADDRIHVVLHPTSEVKGY